MEFAIPVDALVILIGPSGAGKSTFAARHFTTTEVVSSDECRALVSDDSGNMSATTAAFRLLHAITRERLRAGRLAVVDATNLRASSRRPLLAMARRHGRPVVAIVFALALEISLERVDRRRERLVPIEAVRRQHAQLGAALTQIREEAFDRIWVLESTGAVDDVVVVRQARS